MVKLKENWLSILLTVVVIISMVLSVLLWTNAISYERFGRNEFEKNTASQVDLQGMQDVYLPTQVILTQPDESQKMLFGQKQNLVLTLRQTMQKWQLSSFRRVAHDNAQTYLGYLRKDNSVMLSYSDRIATGIFNQTFSQDINTSKLAHLNHIVIPLSGRQEVYLLNDQDFSVYRLNIKKNAQRKAIKKLLQTPGQQIDVDHKIINNQPVVTYPHAIKMPVFAYQVATQDINNLVQNLLSSTNSAMITTRQKGNRTIYMDGASKRLEYNHDTQAVTFANYLGEDSTLAGQNLYRKLYKRLVATEISINWLRFDSVNEKKQTIVFRSYVEGLPIFNENGYGTVKLQANADGVQRSKMSLYGLDIPMPIESEDVKLPSSAVVFNELKQAGKEHEITKMRIGYRWDNEIPSDKIVKLVPTYFVDYQGKWVDYQTLIGVR